MRKRIKNLCKALRDVKTSTAIEEMYFSDRETSNVITKTVFWCMILGLALLFLVPTNGIILYHTLQPHFALPKYSNFIVGCVSYALYYVFMKAIAEDNLLSELSNKVIAFCAMAFVFNWFSF